MNIPSRSSPTVLAGMFFFTVLPRAVLIALVPLEALSLLGSPRSVSVLFLVASAFGVAGSLSIPALMRRIGTAGIFHLAAASACVASVLLYQSTVGWFLIGMVLWAYSAVAFEVSMNLYVLHRIPQSQITRFEPRRILFAVVSYSIGPWLGVYLSNHVADWAPLIVAIVASVISVLYFHAIGLTRTSASARGESSSNPLPHIRRFFAQPRLRLAWFITLARTAWWSTFFIYTPIYAVSVGMSESTGGALVSLGVAMVYTVTLWASLGRRYGFRLLCIGGFAATGLASLVVPLFGVTPTAAAALLIFAAFCAASLDGVGHITYLRAVRPREREIMAGVYGTYRDAAQLLPPGIFAIVLAIASLPAVFGTAGLWMLITAWYARHVPKGLR